MGGSRRFASCDRCGRLDEDSDEYGYSLDVEFAALGENAEETVAAYGAELSAAAGEIPNFHTVETQTGDQIDDVFWAQIGDTSKASTLSIGTVGLS